MSNAGLFGLPQGQRSGSAPTLTLTNNFEISVAMGTQPLNILLYVPAQNRLFCFDNTASGCRVINPDTGVVTATITNASYSAISAAYSPIGDLIVTVPGGNGVSFIRPSTNSVIGSAVPGFNAYSVCFDESVQQFLLPSGSNGWAIYSNTGTFVGNATMGTNSYSSALYVPSTQRTWMWTGGAIYVVNISNNSQVGTAALPVSAGTLFYDPVADRVIATPQAGGSTYYVINPYNYAITAVTEPNITFGQQGSYSAAIKRSIITSGTGVVAVLNTTVSGLENVSAFDNGRFQIGSNSTSGAFTATDGNGKMWMTGTASSGTRSIARFTPFRTAYIKI